MKEEEPVKKEEEQILNEPEKTIFTTERDPNSLAEKEPAIEEGSPSALNEVNLFKQKIILNLIQSINLIGIGKTKRKAFSRITHWK